MIPDRLLETLEAYVADLRVEVAYIHREGLDGDHGILEDHRQDAETAAQMIIATAERIAAHLTPEAVAIQVAARLARHLRDIEQRTAGLGEVAR